MTDISADDEESDFDPSSSLSVYSIQSSSLSQGSLETSDSGINSSDSSTRMSNIHLSKSAMEKMKVKTATALFDGCMDEPSPSSNCSMIETRSLSPLLADKERFYFGFVDVGDRTVQSLQLANSSPNVMRIRCDILRPNEAFELPDGESFLMLGPGENTSLRIAFQPTENAGYTNTLKLSIFNPAFKFTIGLSGYGCRGKVSTKKQDLPELSKGLTAATSHFGNLLKPANRGPIASTACVSYDLGNTAISQFIDLNDASERSHPPGVTCKNRMVRFIDTPVGAFSKVKVQLTNVSPKSTQLTMHIEGSAFSIASSRSQYCFGAMKLVKIPVYFDPTCPGLHRGKLIVSLEDGKVITVRLEATAIV